MYGRGESISMKRSDASGKRVNEVCGRIEGGVCIVSLIDWNRPLGGKGGSILVQIHIICMLPSTPRLRAGIPVRYHLSAAIR